MEREPCPNQEMNNEALCTCPGTGCDKRGVCCVCVEHHRKAGDLPMCMRSKNTR